MDHLILTRALRAENVKPCRLLDIISSFAQNKPKPLKEDHAELKRKGKTSCLIPLAPDPDHLEPTIQTLRSVPAMNFSMLFGEKPPSDLVVPQQPAKGTSFLFDVLKQLKQPSQKELETQKALDRTENAQTPSSAVLKLAVTSINRELSSLNLNRDTEPTPRLAM